MNKGESVERQIIEASVEKYTIEEIKNNKNIETVAEEIFTIFQEFTAFKRGAYASVEYLMNQQNKILKELGQISYELKVLTPTCRFNERKVDYFFEPVVEDSLVKGMVAYRGVFEDNNDTYIKTSLVECLFLHDRVNSYQEINKFIKLTIDYLEAKFNAVSKTLNMKHMPLKD